MLPAYAELHCISNFSFLRGASHPEELVDRARELGYAALALTDECSLAGVVRAHLQARTLNFPLLIGAEFSLHNCIDPTHTGSAFHAPGTPGAHSAAPRLVLLARHREGYGRLSELISAARARAPKGHYQLLPTDLDDGVPGCTALLVPAHSVTQCSCTRHCCCRYLWLASPVSW